MASKIVYSCDKCKKEVPQLFPMTLSVRLNNEGRVPSITREVCNDCLSEFGFEQKADKNYISNYCTLGERIFAIAKKFFSERYGTEE